MFFLTACIEQEAETSSNTTCPDQAFLHLIGKSGSVLKTVTLPLNTRIIANDSAVTLDYNPGRLNIILDAKGKIERVECF